MKRDTYGKAGRELWDSITPHWFLHTGDLAILRQACHLADQIAECDAIVKKEGVMTVGAKGQSMAHPAAQLGKQLRMAQASLIGKMKLAKHPRPPEPQEKKSG